MEGLPRARGWRALNVPPDVEDLLRELAPQVLGALARRSGDFDAAEDAVQEALLAAARALAARRRPARSARLAAADRRAAADRPAAQRPVAARPRETRTRARTRPRRTSPTQDDTLIVLFLCCHPALTPASAIALTLRAVGGLTTARDRERLPGARGDDGAAHLPRQADGSRPRASRSGCRRPPSARPRIALGAARALPDLQRGLRDAAPAPELQRVELSDEAIRLAPDGPARCSPTTPRRPASWR